MDEKKKDSQKVIFKFWAEFKEKKLHSKIISSTKIQDGFPNPLCQSGQVFMEVAVIFKYLDSTCSNSKTKGIDFTKYELSVFSSLLEHTSM